MGQAIETSPAVDLSKKSPIRCYVFFRSSDLTESAHEVVVIKGVKVRRHVKSNAKFVLRSREGQFSSIILVSSLRTDWPPILEEKSKARSRGVMVHSELSSITKDEIIYEQFRRRVQLDSATQMKSPFCGGATRLRAERIRPKIPAQFGRELFDKQLCCGERKQGVTIVFEQILLCSKRFGG
jgi:hypothetical protein